MKDGPTPLDKELGRTLLEVDTPDAEPDFRAMFSDADQIAKSNARKKKAKRTKAMRRTLLVASIAILLLLGSTLMAVLSPPPDAKADTWFDKVVISLRNAFRIETAPGDVDDIQDEQIAEYSSVEEARAAGYHGYVPTYLPNGYAFEKISVSANNVDIKLSDGEHILSLIYRSGVNIQINTPTNNGEEPLPFMWDGFVGMVNEYEGGTVMLSCTNMDTSEMITGMGQVSSHEIIAVVSGMKKAEARP